MIVLFFPACVTGVAVLLYLKWIGRADQDWGWAILALIAGSVVLILTLAPSSTGILFVVTATAIAAVLLALAKPVRAWRWGVGIGVGAGFAAALGTLVTYSQEARHSDVLGPGALLWGFTCLAAIFCGLPATAISALTGWLMRRGE